MCSKYEDGQKNNKAYLLRTILFLNTIVTSQIRRDLLGTENKILNFEAFIFKKRGVSHGGGYEEQVPATHSFSLSVLNNGLCSEPFIRRLKVLTPIEAKQNITKKNRATVFQCLHFKHINKNAQHQNQPMCRLWETAEFSPVVQEARRELENLSADVLGKCPCDLPIRTARDVIATQKHSR